MNAAPVTTPARNWQPIETAPLDGTIVHLRSPRHQRVSNVMFWNPSHKRWEGRALTAMGPVRICWDQSEEQPTEWAPLD